MARRKSALELVRPDAGGAPSRRNRVNFFELAYQRIEDLLVNCELKPGSFLTVQELQTVTGFGRTPVHNAVNQFAADTLIIIRPRHGLQIAPIDLARERLLLGLRRDIERYRDWEFDAAILDISLGRETTRAVAASLTITRPPRGMASMALRMRLSTAS